MESRGVYTSIHGGGETAIKEKIYIRDKKFTVFFFYPSVYNNIVIAL